MASPLFTQVCKLVQLINETRGTDEKKRLVSKFFYGWRHQCGDDFYPVMRLLLPHLDRTRYGIKETKLAKTYIEVLGLGSQSEDAYNLTKWKLPSVSAKVKTTGDFASIATDIIERRSTVTTPTQTVQDVNDLLDTLNRSESDEKKKTAIYKHVVNNYTAFEQRWLIRIVLKDLKMGMSENSVFDVFHPQARELYSVCSNLKKVCDDLQNPTTKLGKSVIGLFQPFKPQLGFKGQPKDLTYVKHKGIFYVEEKIDGERMQMHYESSTHKFKWFSRKATDYTQLYGASSMDEGKLAYEITGCLKKAKSLILDGEMVAYDPKLDVYLPFGTLKTSAKDESLDPDKARPCFIVFDIVYYNSTHLVDYALSDRRKLLNNVLTENRGYLNILEYKERTSEQDIIDEMNIVVDQRQEGIILKNPGSRYECGERNKSWIKIKPEYFDSLGETCDLLVIGGKYGTGRRGNQIAQYMCALRDDRKSASDEPHFVSFSMIGTGFSINQIKEFGQFFRNIQKYNSKNIPSWLSHPEKSTEVPDVIVNNIRDAAVIEVKASEIVFSQMWGAGCTLRFPRFVRFRHDKSWKEVLTYSEMLQTRRSTGQKRKAFSQKDLTLNTKKQRVTKGRSLTSSFSLMPSQQGVTTGNISRSSSLFDGKTFYVINGTNDDLNKTKLEYMIKENGGEFVQTDERANYVIAGKHNIRVDSIIHRKSCDIILPRWITDCIDGQHMISLLPKYMLFTTAKTEQEFRLKLDPYGDFYMIDATDQSLKEIWDNVPDKICDSDVNDIRRRYFNSDGLPGMFFNGLNIYFFNSDQQQQSENHNDNDTNHRPTPLTIEWVKQQHFVDKMKSMSLLIRFYGGKVVFDKNNSTITHVVLQDNLGSTDIAKATRLITSEQPPYFITTKWIQECVKNQTLLDEAQYDPKIPSIYQ
ncbi:ATP dependent DNA ligase domain-containing protein [Chlamydoabsidia padenii]|nr:ATP dependent DNA ligase domain-containing protein [Chlamydoabsidia padenii]